MSTAKLYWNEEIETMPKAEMKSLREEKLRRQLDRVYQQSPYYRDKFDQAGVKIENIRTLEDLQEVPFFTTQELRDTQRDSVDKLDHPFGLHNIVDRGRILLVSATSGTTGVPTFAGLTRDDLAVGDECAARCLWWSGLRPGHVILHAFNLSMFSAGVPPVLMNIHYGSCVIPIGLPGTEKLIQMARLTKPDVLACTPSYAEYLVDKIPETIGRSPRELGLKFLMCTGETGAGEPNVIAKLEGAYGAHIIDCHGATEAAPFAYASCREHSGMHFFAPDHVYCEWIDPETGARLPEEDGIVGEKVVTHLDKESAPLIRYRRGDIERVFFSRCTCGHTSHRIQVIGRVDDMLKVKGVLVYPSAIKDLISGFYPRVTGDIRVVLDRPGPRVDPPMKIKIEYGESVTGDALPGLTEEIKKKMTEMLRVNPELIWLPPQTLERSEHKGKLIEKAYPAA
ncbi:MAG: AMP-binding protein [Thermodesulfobacteriota bacterium]